MTISHSLKEKQRQEREALILQAAEEVLLEKGYHALSMDEIAAQVGIAKGTLYLHFARKDDLVFRLLERELQNILRMIERATIMEGTSRTRLTFILETLYRRLLGKHGQLLYILHNSTELQAAVREKHTKVLRQVADHITALLDEGKATGAFDPLIPTEVMASTFFSVLSPRAYQRLVREKNISPEELVRYVELIYFRGIAAHQSG